MEIKEMSIFEIVDEMKRLSDEILQAKIDEKEYQKKLTEYWANIDNNRREKVK